MATKAERFRYEAERMGPEQPKKPRRKRDVVADTSQPGVSASARRAGGASTGLRNLSLGRKAVYAFEDTSMPNPPSRKSTRKSKNRQKAGTLFKARQQLRTTSPAERHESKK